MLSADEFFVGAVADAKPLSLVLPRDGYDAAMLIGTLNGAPAAVFLSGQFRYGVFPCADNRTWGGVIVPNVRIEMDHTSLNSNSLNGALGSVTRKDTRLLIKAKPESSHSVAVCLHEALTACAEGSTAGFTRWQIVIGEGAGKRILWKTADADGNASSAVKG